MGISRHALSQNFARLVVFCLSVGISYFVYGEKIEIYSKMDPLHKEFMKAGLNLTRSLQEIINMLPWYRIFPIKPYRDFKKAVQGVRVVGIAVLAE